MKVAKKAAKKSAAKRGRPPTKAAEDPKPKAAAPKKGKPQKPPKPPKATTKPGDFDEQQLFHQHLPHIVAQKAKLATANSELRGLYKAAKAHGFDKYDFEIATAVETAEKEAKQKAKIARTLTIAKWCGKSLGNQLDMFLEPDRTPSKDIAHEEGRIDSMQHRPAKPGYDPSTEQYRQYMAGYHEVQAAQVEKGITKPADNTPKGSQPAAAKPDGEAAAVKPKTEPDKPPADPVKQPEPVRPSSGMHMTRADFLKQQEKKRQEDDEARAALRKAADDAAARSASKINGSTPAFASPSTAVDNVEEEEESMFRRKSPATAA